MAQRPFTAFYFDVPIVTRTYATIIVLTTLACQVGIVSPYQLYFNLDLVIRQHQYWRLITTFVFFGKAGLDLFFNLYFLIRYSRSLEEGAFRGRVADFAFMLMFGAFILICIGPFVNIPFLGSALTFMMVYVWGARNPYLRMSFLGLFNFTAPYLPWVLLSFSVLLNSSPIVDLLGIAVGHIYFFLDFEYPRKTGRHLLRTPSLLIHLIEGVPEYNVAPTGANVGQRVVDGNNEQNDPLRPGGFVWNDEADDVVN